MARNPVQFQKGISLNEFFSLYGTEDQCFDALYRWRWPNGLVCPHCGHDRCCQLNTHKLQQCNRCHRQTSITAGTLFEATKLPLTVWFQALYLMTQDKKGVSAMKLHRHLGLSYQRGVAHQAQADAGDDGARPRSSSRWLGRARRCLSRRRAKRGQARSWRTRQDTVRRRRRDQRAGTPAAREAHRGRRLPAQRNRRLGAAATSAPAPESYPMAWHASTP